MTVLVHGASGMGKSALWRRFAEGLVARGALVLEGRCHERAIMPYKALHAVVGALADDPSLLSPADRNHLFGPELSALARLFPRLNHAGARAALAESGQARGVFGERRRAAQALRHVFARIAATRQLVLAIDDLQWGDADSSSLLLDVLAAPDPPRVLLFAAYRSEDAGNVHFARALLRPHGARRAGGRRARGLGRTAGRSRSPRARRAAGERALA